MWRASGRKAGAPVDLNLMMEAGDALGQIEFAVLDAVHRGALRSRRAARQIRVLQGQPAGETILHNALRHCEQNGLLV